MPDKHPFLWLNERSAGVLFHPTSLPGKQGIGVMGSEAIAFIDFLKASGFRYWQMLPLGPTGYGDSPYSSFSAFAGNPYLIDVDPLIENRLLQVNDPDPLRALGEEHVNFATLYKIKWPLLRLAHKRFIEQKRSYLPNYGLFEEFKEQHAKWLEPFCAYMALKERFSNAFWGDWPEDCQSYAAAQGSAHWEETAQARDAHAFFQYLFYGQWAQLSNYAASAGIELIGDIPIFVSLDSADVWSRPELFEMSVPGKPDGVAGVPPDYFSETGQLWGNPLYNWKAMAKEGYTWWLDRLETSFNLFDVIRLDHFRGFYDYWHIPADAKDARGGEWRDGPQDAFFKAVSKRLPGAKLIAEDLGEIHDGIPAFRDRLGLPGMAILQFAFGGGSDNAYLPHNLVSNSVVYPGTHDNDTSRGWYESASRAEKDHVRQYCRINGEDIAWDFIRWSYQCPSNLAIIPMQDILSLDSSARMNSPGTEQGNWQWRMSNEQFQSAQTSADYLHQLAELYGRHPSCAT